MFASQEGCIFCNSYKKDYKKIIWENKEVFSVINYKPSIPGHALIVTKQHLTDLKEITGSILEDFIHAVPQTFEVIQTIYEQKIGRKTAFRQKLNSGRIGIGLR